MFVVVYVTRPKCLGHDQLCHKKKTTSELPEGWSFASRPGKETCFDGFRAPTLLVTDARSSSLQRFVLPVRVNSSRSW